MANRVRNIVLCIPATAQEREMIELKMQQMGTPASPPLSGKTALCSGNPTRSSLEYRH